MHCQSSVVEELEEEPYTQPYQRRSAVVPLESSIPRNSQYRFSFPWQPSIIYTFLRPADDGRRSRSLCRMDDSPSMRHRRTPSEDSGVLGTALTTRHIEAFGRKVTTTASQLIGDPSGSVHYQHAMSELQKELRRPGIQQRVFSYAKASPTELVRRSLFTSEIQHRALTYLPDELLASIPEDENVYSLFQGFKATLPVLEGKYGRKKKIRLHDRRGQKMLDEPNNGNDSAPSATLENERDTLQHRLELMGVRKNMCSAEIREIDNKISNLNSMRKIILERLSDLEQDEGQMENDLLDIDNKLEDMVEEVDDVATLGRSATPPPEKDPELDFEASEEENSFMSASIYEKLPSPKIKRHKISRSKSMPIRHEHFEPGSGIKEFQAHNDTITALDFDVPFGTMVTSALDDTVRVWDLNAGRCIGLLEGHQASVRCLQVEDNIVATGSMDASIRLWNLNQADYNPYGKSNPKSIPEEGEGEDSALADEEPTNEAPPPSLSSMSDCALLTLSAHVAEVTALHFRGNTLVSGSADKTLRQWDLTKGRCVQTLDVLWAAAQASASNNTDTASSSNNPSTDHGQWRKPGSRAPDASADFVGALQSFDAALACGTADGMVRLWDLRSGQVHRSLVGHTGAVTCLQFDERNLVTGSADRSIRIWDLRTGSIHDAYAYDNPVTSMMFDSRRIVAAAGANVAKIYDKTDGRHWDCGSGAAGDDGEKRPSEVERVRVRDGYLTEGRKDGIVGIWTC